MIWTPPAAARAAAARALEVRATLPRSQRAGTPVGIARAVALRDGRPISLDTARRMLAFFTRSARFEAAPKPSKSWQAWNLWGGTPARDALERDPMICLPCMNPRAPVETAAAQCMREIAHRSNPPRMPRTAQEARDALAAAYDDAVGRARVGAFRSDLSATRAALDDAARYSYALGFYGPAPAVPYYLLDRMRAPANARQPDLFARSNPAPALPTVADLQAIKKREKDPIPVFTAWRGVLADYLAAEGYDVAHDPRGGGRTEWTDTGQIAHYIETTDDGDALIYVVDEFGPRAKIKTVYTAPGLIAVARAASKDSPRSRSARASEARENAPPPEPKRRPWATQPENQPRRSLEAEADDARHYIAIYEQQAADARAAGNKTLEMMALDDVATYRADLAAVLADMEREEARQAAEDAALSSWEPEPPALAEINDRVDLLYQRAMLLARTADTVRGTISRRDARLQADKAVSEYEAASRERDKIAAALGVTLPDPLMGVSSPRPAPAPSSPALGNARAALHDLNLKLIAINKERTDAARLNQKKRAERLTEQAIALDKERAAAMSAISRAEESAAGAPVPPAMDYDETDPARVNAMLIAARRAATYYAQEAETARADGDWQRWEIANNYAQEYAGNARGLELRASRIAAPPAAPPSQLEVLNAGFAARAKAAAVASPAAPSPLEVLGAQVEAAAVRAEAAAVAADAVKGKRPRRAARAVADAAADEYADALRARDALSERMGDEAITAAQARARLKRPAPAAKPSKPSKPAKSSPRRPVTGKAREVLARLGALGPVSLGDVARVGCTDDPGARRIVAALIRAEAASPAGPGAWMLDPARLDECPPQRPRTREPRPVCVGECGKWTPPKDAPAWIAALGPTSTIYDSEGRPYPVRWALARLDDLGDGWHASNVGGRADPKYDRELQARERGSSASRAQVEKIAGSLSLAQWVAPSSTPADSAPVVWIDPSARGHVVSGNGRTAAYSLARPSRLAVAETVGGRWKIPKTLRAALESADLVPVRIMGGPGEIDRAAAVLLAGASQASASGSLTQTERALSTVRALGLTVADMPALDWPEALTVARLVAFIASNRAWAAWATAPLAPERAILLSSDPLALTVHFRDVLIGLLPPEAREGGIGGLSIDRALVGALPGIWTLETRIRDGRAPSAWSLVAVLPEARGWARKSAGRLKEIAADAATDERQAGLFGPARLDTEGARLLAVALGGALARASGRTDPEAAGAEMVAALLAAAPDPSQPSLLGIDDADPVEVFARKARLSLPRSNPPGRDLARLSDAARRWHWGRYKRAKSARVDRATWQPSQGFALGELAAISLGADRLEVPPGHLLCATEEGDGADLFVVPPLPLGSLAPRPLRAIEYLADKAGDGPSWYVHDFDPAYPQATTKGGALAIVRKGSRFSIDPERGIVG